MADGRRQMDSVERQTYRSGSALAFAFGLLLWLTLELAQVHTGIAASAAFEFMGLYPGMTLDQAKRALQEQGINSPKLSRAPSFKQKVTLARNEYVSPTDYNGVQTLRAQTGDKMIQIHFVAMPEGPVAAKITVDVLGGADANALSDRLVSQYGSPGRKTAREWLWGDTAKYFYARKSAYVEFRPSPVSMKLHQPVAAIVLADPAVQERSENAIAADAKGR